MKVLLFDIDGTLMLSGGAGLRAMNQAFKEVYGVDDALLNMDLAGRTDTSIIKQALKANNLVFSVKQLERFKNRYYQLLPSELNQPSDGKKTMPGVTQLLRALSQREMVYLGLLTGNWEVSGRIKLNSFNLDRYFLFGAFADDSEDRDALLPFAVERFTQIHNLKPRPEQVYVIGDTPADIRCAKPHQAISVAVAASRYTAHELKQYHPDFVFHDLTDTDKVLKVLG